MPTELPLAFYDVGSCVVVIAITVLAVSEMLSPRYGRTDILIDRMKLRQVAKACWLFAILLIAIGIILQLFF